MAMFAKKQSSFSGICECQDFKSRKERSSRCFYHYPVIIINNSNNNKIIMIPVQRSSAITIE